jgi:hypothetical protein
LSRTVPSALDLEFMDACLNIEKPLDRLCAEALSESLRALASYQRRGAPPGVTGHVAESDVETLFVDLGFHPIWHSQVPAATAWISSC